MAIKNITKFVGMFVLLFFILPLIGNAFLSEVKTLPANNIGKDTAILNGTIKAIGQGSLISAYFKYTTTQTNNCIGMQNQKTTAKKTVNLAGIETQVTQALTGLKKDTSYYFCLVGSQDGVPVYGKVQSFSTPSTDNGLTNGLLGGLLGVGISLLDDGFGKSGTEFGGIITDTKAKEVRKLESSGFVCNVPGKSIEIKPVGKKADSMPTSYLIPTGVTSKTKYNIAKNQQIMGKYDLNTVISCVNSKGGVITVPLTIITLYGNSKSGSF